MAAMTRRFLAMFLLFASFSLVLSGCFVRTHPRHGHRHHGVHKGKPHKHHRR